MAKFIKPFRGVPEGEIYPVQFVAGDDCPPELEAGALSVGALSLMADTPPPILLGSSVQPASFELPDGSVQVAAEDKPALMAQLESAGIPFDKRWGAEKLAAALAEGKKD